MALERIERVAEKRRAREEKKAAERALRLEQRMISDSTERPEKKPGTRSKERRAARRKRRQERAHASPAIRPQASARR